MSFKNYFQYVPDFEYVSRLPDRKYINDYLTTKNLFKRVKLSDEIFGDLTYFDKVIIQKGERPDNLAKRLYDDENLDWMVMLCNNIVNYESEWPMDQISYDNYLLSKYGSIPNLESIHHYETREVVDSNGFVILPKGMEVNQNFTISYYDSATGTEQIASNVTDAITNRLYEDRIEEQKSSIFVLKQVYLSVVLDEILNLMPYKEGSTQYVGASLVRGDNIRLYS